MDAAARDSDRDARRLGEVERYGLDGLRAAGARTDLDGLARLAARVFDASMAMVTYIDGTHLRTLATIGFDSGELPRAASLCNEVLYDDEPLYGEDLRADPRYAGSIAAVEGFGRFYVSQQLRTPGGEPFGSLCVFDPEPRPIDDSQREAMRDLAERVVDVLELDLRTRELTTAVGELRRSNEALAAFAGQVSHDLRNPLTALSGTLEVVDVLLEDDDPDLEAARPLVTRARRSTRRMAQLVDDVLELAEVGGELHLAEVDVDTLVAAVREDLVAELDGVDLVVDPLPTVVADAVQLRVVVQNLLTNAVKHAVPGATASVRLGAVVRPGWWRLEVVDRGRGVAPADRERVFEAFTRLDESVPGTGVGLATCLRVAEAHHGRMGIDETPGGGATVWFEIPHDGRSPHS